MVTRLGKRTALRTSCGALLVIFVLMEVAIGTAWARPRKDTDGTRMRARKATAQKVIKDTVSAPNDRHDWRYIEIDKAGKLTVSLTAVPKGASVTLRVLNGSGELIKDASTGRDGERRVSVRANPGIYYIDVGIKTGKASYTLNIKL